MSVINQSDIEHIDEALRKFANQKNMNGFCGHPDRLHGMRVISEAHASLQRVSLIGLICFIVLAREYKTCLKEWTPSSRT